MGVEETTGTPQSRPPEATPPSDAAGLLDHLADAGIDRLTRLAARMLAAPLAAANITDTGCVWSATQQDVDLSRMRDQPDLCDMFPHDGRRVLCDVRRHDVARCHPLVSGPPWLRFYAGAPLMMRNGAPAGVLCVFDTRPRRPSPQQLDALDDIAALMASRLELRRAVRETLAQKEDLIREVNHRVSNSLQVVSNLLTLQARSAGEVAQRSLDAAARRVSAVAYIHRRLYQGGRGGMIDFKPYVTELCEDIRRAVSADGWHHRFVVVADGAEMPTQRATAFGLILNELVTNAIKHGYPAGVPGCIVIGFHIEDGQYVLTVADDGCGLPATADPWHAKGLGMRIIRALTGQLAGTLSFHRGKGGHGTAVTVRCPAAHGGTAD